MTKLTYNMILCVVAAAALLPLRSNARTKHAPPLEPNQFGNWKYEVWTDDMTDAKNSYIATQDDYDSGMAGTTLLINCNSSGLSASFLAHAFLGSGERTLTYRVDGKVAVSVDANYGKDNTADLSDNDSADLIVALKTAQQLRVRFATYDGGVQGGTINVKGTPQAINRILKDCPPSAPPVESALKRSMPTPSRR